MTDLLDSLAKYVPMMQGALAALSFLTSMRPGAGEAVFALARTAGWIAHALEQYERPTFVRGRVDYVGPSPADRSGR